MSNIFSILFDYANKVSIYLDNDIQCLITLNLRNYGIINLIKTKPKRGINEESHSID